MVGWLTGRLNGLHTGRKENRLVGRQPGERQEGRLTGCRDRSLNGEMDLKIIVSYLIKDHNTDSEGKDPICLTD